MNILKKILKVLGVTFLGVTLVGFLLINHYAPVLGAQFGQSIYILPPSVERYGEIAIEIMNKNGYYANSKEWLKFQKEAEGKLKDASSYEETHAVIEEALKVVGGKHSFLMTEQRSKNQELQYELPSVERNEDVLFITLPPISDAITYGKDYASTVLHFLEENQEANGAVIDLRNNNGGDMGPMVTAVSPFLADGEILSFAYRQYEQPVLLNDMQVQGGGTSIDVDINPFKIDIPIAVLVNGNTASSAEAVYMALMGNEKMKSFGEPTAGYASANAPYELYDGSKMQLTVAYNQTKDGLISGKKESQLIFRQLIH